MTALVAITGQFALAITAAALVAGALVLGATRRPVVALAVLLDLLLAAGLLRLTGEPGWRALATAAAIVLLRQLLEFGLGVGRGSHAPGPSGGGTRKPERGRRIMHRLLRPAWLEPPPHRAPGP